MEIETRICNKCNKDLPIEDFSLRSKSIYRRRSCKKCRNRHIHLSLYADTERHAALQQYARDYHKKHAYRAKVKSYQHHDRLLGRESLTMEEFRQVIESESNCHYCGESDFVQLGLDRLDNTLGHTMQNVVTCCEKCNNILSDIPYTAKLLLAPGLAQIYQQSLLKDWVIPTKRNACRVKTINE